MYYKWMYECFQGWMDPGTALKDSTLSCPLSFSFFLSVSSSLHTQARRDRHARPLPSTSRPTLTLQALPHANFTAEHKGSVNDPKIPPLRLKNAWLSKLVSLLWPQCNARPVHPIISSVCQHAPEALSWLADGGEWAWSSSLWPRISANQGRVASCVLFVGENFDVFF